MGAAVLRRACAACAAWPDGVSVSVNLSSTQFRNGNLEKTILGALAAANLAPERLDLEITELTLLEDRGDTRRALQALRARGLRISLDDFGTGYSIRYAGQLCQQKQLFDRSNLGRVCAGVTRSSRSQRRDSTVCPIRDRKTTGRAGPLPVSGQLERPPKAQTCRCSRLGFFRF